MNAQEVAKRCVESIQRRMQSEKTLFVAISGDSGSGKSFYSQLVRSELEFRKISYSYINADDFLVSRVDREPMKNEFYEMGEFQGKSKWEILENMFRLDEFERVIDELRDVGISSYKPYRRETGSVDRSIVKVKAEKLIIFDTSMLLEKMDFIIVIDVDMERIIERKIIRDADIRTPEQVEEMHRKVQGYYWQRMKPIHPDIIIDNNDFDNPVMHVRAE